MLASGIIWCSMPKHNFYCYYSYIISKLKWLSITQSIVTIMFSASTSFVKRVCHISWMEPLCSSVICFINKYEENVMEIVWEMRFWCHIVVVGDVKFRFDSTYETVKWVLSNGFTWAVAYLKDIFKESQVFKWKQIFTIFLNITSL